MCSHFMDIGLSYINIKGKSMIIFNSVELLINGKFDVVILDEHLKENLLSLMDFDGFLEEMLLEEAFVFVYS